MLLQSLTYLATFPLAGHALRTRQDDSDDDDDRPRDQFRRRGSQSLAVLGDYLYLEGGEISSWYNGEREGNADSGGLTSTQIISLAEAWSNSSVEITILQKTAPETLKSPSLWADESTGRLYRWGGARSGNQPIQLENTTLWRFDPDDNEGEWSQEPPSNRDVFDDIIAGGGAAFAACGGLGLAAGGHAFESTDARLDSTITPLPGMVAYDFVTREWSNETTVPVHAPSGTFNLAQGLCVPEVASDPLFFILGGADTTAVSHREKELRSFRNITFYNPAEKTWHWQETSGDIPGGRDLTCAAGVAGPNGTYEIFLHAGRHPVDGLLSDIFVLSLPGFTWFRVEDHGSTSRHSLACISVGGGQVVVSGGIGDDGWAEQDPWRHSLNVFDMSSLAWSDSYETEKEYETPQMIRDWYDQGGLDGVAWSSDDVRDMFAGQSSTSPPDNDDSDSGSGTPVGAIAGGVVGGVAAVALIGALLFFLRRRRGKRDNYSAANAAENAGSPKDTDRKASPGYYAELHSQHSPAPVELEQRQYHSELDSGSRTAPPSELPTEANTRP